MMQTIPEWTIRWIYTNGEEQNLQVNVVNIATALEIFKTINHGVNEVTTVVIMKAQKK